MCRYTTLWNVSVLRITIKKKTTSAATQFKTLTTKTTCFCLSYCLKGHISQFLHQLFNVSALLLDDASKNATPCTDQWREPNAAPVCPTQWQSLASACLLSWIVNIDRPSVEEHPKPHNWLSGLFGAAWQARSTLITQLVNGVAGLIVSSDISQNSVATHLKIGGIYSNGFITNCLLILTVKNFLKIG